jgi:hypothetical protein
MLIKKTSLLLFLALLPAASVEVSLAQTKRGIRSVDFYNFTYELAGRAKVTLKNGSYKKNYARDSNTISTSKLLVLKYADFDGDGKEEALMLIKSKDTGGSNHGDNDYFVFAYRAGKPRQIFHEYREGPEGLCLKNRSIIIIAEAWKDAPIPHCCPPFTETKVYRWRGSDFAVVKTYRRKNFPFQNPKLFEKARRCENFR